MASFPASVDHVASIKQMADGTTVRAGSLTNGPSPAATTTTHLAGTARYSRTRRFTQRSVPHSMQCCFLMTFSCMLFYRTTQHKHSDSSVTIMICVKTSPFYHNLHWPHQPTILFKQVSINILQCARTPAGLTSFAALTNTTTSSDCQTPSGQIPGDKPEQGIDGYGGKDFLYLILWRHHIGITTTRALNTCGRL